MFKKKSLAKATLALSALVAAPFVQVDHHAEAASKYEKHEKHEKHDKKKNDCELKIVGQKLFGLAHQALKTGEPVPVKVKGQLLGYLVVSVEKSDKGNLITVNFVKELPVQKPAQEAPAVEEQPSQEPAQEVSTEDEQSSQGPVEEAPPVEEQTSQDSTQEAPTVEEQPSQEPVDEITVIDPTELTEVEGVIEHVDKPLFE
jgi:hypothetical protein